MNLDEKFDEAIGKAKSCFVVAQAMAKNEFAVVEENTKLQAENKNLKQKAKLWKNRVDEAAEYIKNYEDIKAENERYKAVIEKCIKTMEGSNCLELEWLEEALKGE